MGMVMLEFSNKGQGSWYFRRRSKPSPLVCNPPNPRGTGNSSLYGKQPTACEQCRPAPINDPGGRRGSGRQDQRAGPDRLNFTDVKGAIHLKGPRKVESHRHSVWSTATLIQSDNLPLPSSFCPQISCGTGKCLGGFDRTEPTSFTNNRPRQGQRGH